MPKLKVLLLTAFLLVAPFCYSAGTTERHLLEQCISYEDLGTAIRYGTKLGGLPRLCRPESLGRTGSARNERDYHP